MTTLSTASSSTLTPCGSPMPDEIPVQPDHFYGSHNIHSIPSPSSDRKSWLDPADDPLAQRGIPVFKPTMEEFQDFEAYMNRVECWGSRSGIVKVIPPKDWTDSLPPIKDQLADIKIKSPIEQVIFGDRGLFRQQNVEKRKWMSVREWVELCSKEDYRAPSIHEVNLAHRTAPVVSRPKIQRKGKRKRDTMSSGPATEVQIKDEPREEDTSVLEENGLQSQSEKPNGPLQVSSAKGKGKIKEESKPRLKRVYPSREAREANLADRAARDRAFIDIFDPHAAWLPPDTTMESYTPEFCQHLERRFWRGLGLGGKPAWYGADTQGSLFTDSTKSWNVAHLPSALSRLLPSSSNGLPGVNTPYLYFGMWRATFAWHVEDMDLFSINFIHFGAPKFWYAIPQGRSAGLEQAMRSNFPKDTSQCSQFLRHKSFLASPSALAKDSCKPNFLVQQSGEFVITFPRGYHAGFNLGLNCAESVNFALDSWLEIGRKAKACNCVSDSVRIDIDQLLREREAEGQIPMLDQESSSSPTGSSSRKGKMEPQGDAVYSKAVPRKRKPEADVSNAKAKRTKVKEEDVRRVASSSNPKVSITLKLGPRTDQEENFPCCLCVSSDTEGLLLVVNPPFARKDLSELAGHPKVWMAHELCARVVPETWVDTSVRADGTSENFVYGIDSIVKDRWNLKCAACTRPKFKAHGAPIQCTKGKCAKAFHVNCARDGQSVGLVFSVVQEVDKEVVLLDNTPAQERMPNGTTENQHRMMGDDMRHVSSPGCVVRIVKKLDIQTLCSQHNPAIAAQKKANKQDKIRNELLSLPSMSRVKIRVSAGLFEVSLIRVIEETGSVEVLWDQNTKKEFKWGSVVLGSTDTPIQQKPSEGLPALPPNSGVVSMTPNSYCPINHSLVSPSVPSSVVATMKPQLYKNGSQMTYPTFTGAFTYGQWATTNTTGSPYAVPQPQPHQPSLHPYAHLLAATSTTVPQHQIYGVVPHGTQQQVEMQSRTTSTLQPNANTPLSSTSASERSDVFSNTTITNGDSCHVSSEPTTNTEDEESVLQSSQLAEILRANPELASMILAAIGRPQ